jgi:superfamily I DNA and RNA helicase
MAKIIPTLNRQTLSKMTSGEKRVARRLEVLLEDDYLIWYDIPVGNNRRNPDFIILHPSRGLLILEIKDWKSTTLQKITKTEVELNINGHTLIQTHPLEQARECTYEIVNVLQKDPQLQQAEESRKGRLVLPYGWGAIFTNISRKQIQKLEDQEMLENVLPDHLIMYSDDLDEEVEAEIFQEKLWNMFNYKFKNKLTLPQIDRIRWHLFPEIRISDSQINLFESVEVEDAIPEIVKIMDIQQEQLARSMGDGHRVIHGVAGSGKTLILGYRGLHLARLYNKPILVLCYNVSLAAKLRFYFTEKRVDSKVQVYHFHDWCSEQLKMYHVKLRPSEKPIYEQMVEAVISGVEKNIIPRAQYGALLIDEGHDFEPEWLKLVVQMVEPKSNSVLLLYDDAQSIYKKQKGLGFSLSSVGIEAAGRTTILKINYRNTKEISHFAYMFAKNYFTSVAATDDQIPLIEPESIGARGPQPVVQRISRVEEEIAYSLKCLRAWRDQGLMWSDMAIIFTENRHGEDVARKLKILSIPNLLMTSRETKKAYTPQNDLVSILSIHSSKGLDFTSVIMIGVDQLRVDEENRETTAKLLYVGMTRSQKNLVVMTNGRGEFGQLLVKMSDS